VKKRILSLLLALTALLCILPASAAEESAVSTNAADLVLKDNANKNYVMGNGMGHTPNESFLCANEDGGVTLVQYVGNRADPKFAVAEFDADLAFRNVRYLPLDSELLRWGGFCTGGEHYYVAYSIFSRSSSARLVVEKYDRDWKLVQAVEHALSNTKTAIDSDFDMVAANGKLFITMNRYMSGGHQANGRLELSAATLDILFSQLGTADFDGYCSHSYVPEIVVSGENIYAFDRCDAIPGEAIFMSSFSGSLANGIRMIAISGTGQNDWGNLGNAIPGPNGTVLTAYNYAPNTGINSEPDNCKVSVFYSGGIGRVEVTGSSGSGTPLLAAASDTTGFVLWNPDLYTAGDNGLRKDDLFYASYTIDGSRITVWVAQKAGGHYLSDCEPIAFDGGILWFTVEDGELVFHQLKGNEKPTKKIAHRYAKVEGREPTCSKPGLTEGTACVYCGEIGVVQQEIPMVPHTAEPVPGWESTCAEHGRTAGERCAVCKTVLNEGEELPKLPHTEEDIPAAAPTCIYTGRTAGKKCSVCGEVTVKTQTIPATGHQNLHTTEGRPATCVQVGLTDYVYCLDCGRTVAGREEIPRLPHEPVEAPARPGTCLEEGREAGTVCGMCDKILSGCESTGLGGHDGVDTEAVPPTASCTGLTAGTKCALCDEQLTGAEVIPALVVDVVSVGAEGERVTLRAALKYGGYYMMCAFYDESGTLLGVKGETVWARQNGLGDRENEAVYDVAFPLLPDSASFRIFALNYEGACEYAPVCLPISGKI